MGHDGEGRGWRRLAGRRDVVLAAVVGAAVALTSIVSWEGGLVARAVPPLGWLLVLGASGALVLRRRFPLAVAMVTLVASAFYYPLITADGAIVMTLVVALYTLAAEGRLVAAGAVSLAAVVLSGMGEFGTAAEPVGDAGIFLLIGWLVAAVAVGAVSRSRRDYLREVQERALEAELGRDREARRRATEERLRIARELHDVLGHNISLINVQAGAALHGIERDPGQAAEALAAIKETSKETLQELRTTLGVLRQVDEAAPTTPPPSLDRLGELTERTEATGLDVRVETTGERGALPPAVDLAAYRIVQEALTNVTRHARARSVVVRVGYGRDDVTVDVEDDGRGAAHEPGHGIQGMSERARAVGGTLAVAERDGGGVRVSARLPVEGAR